MSGIAALFNVPGNRSELDSWASAHATHHRDIIRRIYEITGANLPEYVLDPIDPEDTGVWEDQHQIMHQDMDTVLGISGFDLSGVDFNNYEELVGWIQLNSSEHFQASNILEIG